MPDRTEVRTGTCPEHGEVEATKVVPGVRFPFIVWAVQRATSGLKPYRCPRCDSKAKVSRGS